MNTALTRNRYPCFTALNLPAVRSPTTPAALRAFGPAFFPEAYRTSPLARIPCGTIASWASPFASKLATASGRIEFVILPTSSSSPVALHLASRRRSYLRLSKPGRAPSEDFHLTDSLRSQAHWRAWEATGINTTPSRSEEAKTRETYWSQPRAGNQLALVVLKM
jgi:hypothetical protein